MSVEGAEGVVSEELAVAALERWLVREVVQRDLIASLRSVDSMRSAIEDERTIAGCLFKLLRTFPLFASDGNADAALREVFCALPSIDASLRARGSPGLKTYLSPLLTSQILSAARARRRTQGSVNLTSVEYAARALVEISGESGGLRSFIDELKSAHSFTEMRPSVRHWADTVRGEVSGFLAGLASDPNSAAKLKTLMSRLPRDALLIMLRMHMAGKASSMALSMALTRVNGSSMLQRLVSDALGYSAAKEELESLRSSSFYPNVASALEEFARNEYTAWMERLSSTLTDELGNPLSGRSALEWSRRCIHDYVLLSSNGAVDMDEPTCWQALRYVELLSSKRSTEDIVELLGEPALVNALSRLLSSAHSQLALCVFTKGSQMTKLAEEVFACLDDALSQLPSQGSGDSAERERYGRMDPAVERVMNRLIGVAHNVLVADRNGIMHRTISWAFHFYQLASKIQLPTNALLGAIKDDSERNLIMQEAKRVLYREEKAIATGNTKVPRPRLIVSERLLLEDMTQSIITQLGSLLQGVGETVSPSQRAGESASRALGIKNLEVVPDHSEDKIWSDLSARKFVLCGRTRSASIWVRYGADVPSALKSDMRPIVEIVFSDSERRVLEKGTWTLVPRNLNKGMLGRSKTFLWYRRAADDFESSAFAITGLELVPRDADERKRAALSQCGYRTVTSFDKGLFGSVDVWVHGGVLQGLEASTIMQT